MGGLGSMDLACRVYKDSAETLNEPKNCGLGFRVQGLG